MYSSGKIQNSFHLKDSLSVFPGSVSHPVFTEWLVFALPHQGYL